MSDKENAAEKALAELLDKSMQAGDFLVEQAPMVVQELLAYKTAEHAIYSVVFFLVCAISTSGAFNRLNSYRKVGDPDDLGWFMVLSFLSASSLLLFVSDLLSLVKVMIAPKVYLLEYAAALVK